MPKLRRYLQLAFNLLQRSATGREAGKVCSRTDWSFPAGRTPDLHALQAMVPTSRPARLSDASQSSGRKKLQFPLVVFTGNSLDFADHYLRIDRDIA